MANSKKSLCNSVCDIFSMLQSTKDIDQAKKDLKHPKKASLSHCDVDKITQTSHTKNGICTLKNQYFSTQNIFMRLILSVPELPAYIWGDVL